MGSDDVIEATGVHVPHCNFRCKRSGHWLLTDEADRNTAMHIHDCWMGKECDACLKEDRKW